MIIVGLAAFWTLLVAAVWARASNVRGATLGTAPLPPRIVVLRPVTHADAPALACAQPLPSWAAHPSVSFLILADEADAVVGQARQLCDQLRAAGVCADLLLTHPRRLNRKAGQLAAAAAFVSDADIVAVMDADVDLPSVALDALLAPFGDAGVGAAWMPFVLAGPSTTAGDRVARAVLHGSLHAVPLLARLDPQSTVSKVIAYRPQAMAQVGGWSGLEACLGDDMALGEKLRGAGWRVCCAAGVARTQRNHTSLADVWQRMGRWCAIMVDQRPAFLVTYPLLLSFTPYLLGLWGWALARGGSPAVVGLGAAITVLVRLLIARTARRACGDVVSWSQAAVDSVLSDFFIAAVMWHALLGRDVTWAGRRLPRRAAASSA